MNESEYQHWREAGWRRPLDPVQEAHLQAYLALHPQAQADWESEAELTRVLGHLRDTSLPSNFTSQVLQAVERETAMAPQQVRLWQRLEVLIHRAVPRLAWTCVLVALGFLGYHQYQAHAQDELARGLLRFSAAANMNDPALFKDFEAIQRLGQMPPPTDEDLWLALNQPLK